MTAEHSKSPHHCAFCGKNGDEVLVLIAGPSDGLFICDECVKLCDGIVFEHRVRRAAAELIAKAPALAALSSGSAANG